jgi:hypothetical protein
VLYQLSYVGGNPGPYGSAPGFGRRWRAAERLYVAVQGQRAVVEAGANRLTRDPVCADALARVPKGEAADDAARPGEGL